MLFFRLYPNDIACVIVSVKLAVGCVTVGTYSLIGTGSFAACVLTCVLTLGANAVFPFVVFLGYCNGRAAGIGFSMLRCGLYPSGS